MKKVKMKIRKKYIILLIILAVFVVSFVTVIAIKNNKYPKNVENVFEWNKDLYIITFKNDFDLLDNCTMTTDLYYKILKNENDISTINLEKYIETENPFSIQETYSISAAVEKGIISYDMKYTDYLAITCGFNNTKELLKNTKIVLKKYQKNFKG